MSNGARPTVQPRSPAPVRSILKSPAAAPAALPHPPQPARPPHGLGHGQPAPGFAPPGSGPTLPQLQYAPGRGSGAPMGFAPSVMGRGGGSGPIPGYPIGTRFVMGPNGPVPVPPAPPVPGNRDAERKVFEDKLADKDKQLEEKDLAHKKAKEEAEKSKKPAAPAPAAPPAPAVSAVKPMHVIEPLPPRPPPQQEPFPWHMLNQPYPGPMPGMFGAQMPLHLPPQWTPYAQPLPPMPPNPPPAPPPQIIEIQAPRAAPPPPAPAAPFVMPPSFFQTAKPARPSPPSEDSSDDEPAPPRRRRQQPARARPLTPPPFEEAHEPPLRQNYWAGEPEFLAEASRSNVRLVLTLGQDVRGAAAGPSSESVEYARQPSASAALPRHDDQLDPPQPGVTRAHVAEMQQPFYDPYANLNSGVSDLNLDGEPDSLMRGLKAHQPTYSKHPDPYGTPLAYPMPNCEPDDPLSRDIYTKLNDTMLDGGADLGGSKQSKDPWAYAHLGQHPLDMLDYRPDPVYADTIGPTYAGPGSGGSRTLPPTRSGSPSDDYGRLGGLTEFSDQPSASGFYHPGAYDEPSQALERRAY